MNVRAFLPCLAVLVLPFRTGVAAELTFRTPAGIVYLVNADGLASIRQERDGRELARGGWRFVNAESLFELGPGTVRAAVNPPEKTCEVIAPDHARVRHAGGGDVAAVYDYTFAGEDVTVRARVENNHADAPVAVAGFSGLSFLFHGPPRGQMPGWHVSYLRHVGRDIFHPGFHVRIGGTWGTDGTFGVGASPVNTGLARTLLHWDRNWGVADLLRDAGPRSLSYYVLQEIPAGGARTFAMRLRVSPDTGWRHLMEPYREHFRATFGDGLRYRADHRFLVQGVVADPTWRKEGNPHGYQESRRLDLPAGAAAYVGEQARKLHAGNGQGLMLWAQGGGDPRGAMYRPDFDLLPPETEANWPAIVKRLADDGLSLGVTARPGDFAFRLDWKTDGTLRLDAHDPAHVAMTARRFERMRGLGCKTFYLDSFGASLEDVVIMRALRARLGPEVPTFTEHPCDAILPDTGAYFEMSWAGGADDARALAWGLDWFWEFARWLLPEAGSTVVLRKPGPDRAADLRWLYGHHLSPMLADHDYGLPPERLREVQGEFVDEKGGWRK